VDERVLRGVDVLTFKAAISRRRGCTYFAADRDSKAIRTLRGLIAFYMG